MDYSSRGFELEVKKVCKFGVGLQIYTLDCSINWG